MGSWLKMMVVSVSVAVVAASAFAGGDKGEKDRGGDSGVPASILAAFAQAYPTAEIKKAKAREEAGVEGYKVEAVVDGVEQSFQLSETGAGVAIEQKVEAEALPDAVKSALASTYPERKIKKTARITTNGWVQYDVTVEGEKTKTRVLLDVAGRIVSATDEVGEDHGRHEDDQKKKD
jgi:hypothetical protein